MNMNIHEENFVFSSKEPLKRFGNFVNLSELTTK